MILDRYSNGNVLVTFATGEISDKESDRTGLVSGHAYAMLDIKHVNGQKLFLLKRNGLRKMNRKGSLPEKTIQH